MEVYIIGTVAFALGFIIAKIIYKKKNYENTLFSILTDFRNSVEKYENQQNINAKEIQEAIKGANELKKMLTTNQNLKGQFGEDCLEAIIKTCFPNENINYIKQVDSENEDGQKIRPDFLIRLPNDKNILIDCKVNLIKYIEYRENQDETIAKDKKSEFIKDLNTTINLLANKKYDSAKGISQPDFILMYVPLEPIITAIYTDADFLSVIKNATEKNIIIVGNSSVLTTLRLVRLLWAQDKQEKNMENIISIAENIFETIAKHSQNLSNIKKIIEESNVAISKEYEKFSTESKLFKLTQELKDCGIRAKNQKIGRKLNTLEIQSEFLATKE